MGVIVGVVEIVGVILGVGSEGAQIIPFIDVQLIIKSIMIVKLIVSSLYTPLVLDTILISISGGINYTTFNIWNC